MAIEALKIGATDYVLKTRLSRILLSVRRALREGQERAERVAAEAALRRSEAYLAEGQRLSHTGSFGWNVRTGENYWSDETYRIFEFDRATTPSIQLIFERVHPEDAEGMRLSCTAARSASSDPRAVATVPMAFPSRKDRGPALVTRRIAGLAARCRASNRRAALA